MNLNRLRHAVPALLILLLVFSACNKSDEPVTPSDTTTPAGKLTAATECKIFLVSNVTSPDPKSESCLVFSFNAEKGLLMLRHINAGFNCCPGKLSADITVVDNIITIREMEEVADCRCDCLYDLDFEIENLAPGNYRIVIVEPYLSDTDTAIDFEVDLAKTPSGRHCVPRCCYPWGLY